jgi:hypothetical protein
MENQENLRPVYLWRLEPGTSPNIILGRCGQIKICYVQWHRKLIHRHTQNDV